jgi:hypothetical protein
VDKRVVEEGGGEEIEVEPAEDVSEEPVIPPSTEPSIRPEEMDTISPTEGPVIEPADEASLTTPEGTASVPEMTVIEHDVGPPRSAEVPDDTGPEAVEVEYDEGAETGPEAVEVEYDEGADTGPDDITRPQDAVLVETGPPVLEMGPVDEPLKNGRLISTLTSEEVDPQHRGNGKRGLLSSKGLVNGSSLVNGNGMVNGRGLVNGKGTPRMGDAERPTDDHHPTRKPRKRSRLLKIGATVVIVGLMLMMGPLIAFRFLDEGAPGMVVDGDLSDWSGVLFYEDGMDVSIPNRDLDIVRYSATFDGKDMWFYARVDGDMLSGRHRCRSYAQGPWLQRYEIRCVPVQVR